MSALDPVQAAGILGLLRARHQTLILAMHDVPLALANSDRIIVLDAGRVVLDALGGWFLNILQRQVLPGVVDTLVLSQVALVAMAALALVLFPLITRRAGRLGRPAGRALLVVVRSTPEYMLAYVLLQVLGPSMLPAIIALALHNGGIVGYLMGGHADELAYRVDAPRGLNLYFYETVPRLYGQFLAYVLYRWEIIVRESAIFGILGVPTLGYYVDAAISELRLDVALVLIIATGVLSVVIDMFSRALRRQLRIDDRPVRLSTAGRAQGVKLECA